MRLNSLYAAGFTVFLGGCAASLQPQTTPQALNGIPDQVTAIAAPFQNVATARKLAQDGCYWYVHEGPVETTFLPLRTGDGRPICSAPQKP